MTDKDFQCQLTDLGFLHCCQTFCNCILSPALFHFSVPAPSVSQFLLLDFCLCDFSRVIGLSLFSTLTPRPPFVILYYSTFHINHLPFVHSTFTLGIWVHISELNQNKKST